MKKVLSLIALLAAAAVLMACTGSIGIIGGADGPTSIFVTSFAPTAEAEEEDPILASAFDGEITVRLSEAREDFEESLDYYLYYYSQYGYSIDEYDTDFQASVAQESVQYLLARKIIDRHAALIGYVLDEETDAQFFTQAQAQVESMRSQLRTYAAAYGFEEDELDSVVEEELANAGYTVEDIYDTSKLSHTLEYISNYATAGTEVSDEEIRASFDSRLAAAQESYADIDTFIADYVNGADILYTPEGVRLMHVIYFALESDAHAPEEGAEGIEALVGREKAQAVLDLIRGGMDFDEAMFTYDEDTSTEEAKLTGYPMGEGAMTFGSEFCEAAMALEQPGDVSDVVETSFGYFLMEYDRDLTPGAVAFEGREEAEAEAALASKKETVYSDYISALLEEADESIGDLSPLYHVYVSEPVEVTVAYASVPAETALTDMPEGDAVATLAAGATLDVLGRIGMDGEEYAFVAVPGTSFKGYVNVKAFETVDEETALSADNGALVTAAAPVDKLPTFTIAMNDGSLIYGELYPDVTPESVGNFAELANAGFYDGLIFHRVIAGFMIQGGDPLGNGTGGPGYAIKGEFSANGVENDLSHTRGVLSMARANDPDSAGSQFFIVHADSDYLDGQYAAFGLVLGGMETVDAIASIPTDSSDKPMTDQVMRTVYVETYGQSYPFTKLAGD